MNLRFDCPDEHCVAIIEYEPLESADEVIQCPRCGKEHRLQVSEQIRTRGALDQCVICGGREMFIRKDFPQFIGLAVVLVAGVASLFAFRTNPLLSWAILASAVVIDLLLYAFIGKLTVCYACRAQYRGGELNPEHEGFDLATSEKY